MGFFNSIKGWALPTLGMVGMAAKFIPGGAVTIGALGAVIGAGAAVENGGSPWNVIATAAIDGVTTGLGGKAGLGIATAGDAVTVLKGLAGVVMAGGLPKFGDFLTKFIPGRHHNQAGDPPPVPPLPPGIVSPGTGPAPYVQLGDVPPVDITDLHGQYTYV
ncbi:hypothetical protein ACFXPS_38795 [Nocardia sp. NPDC059091]|uniref:hypothetical protein n=1 Tax=unclassified Nocardia TaxID=2637762 RepID=UPI0036A33819